jgi:NTE family protein
MATIDGETALALGGGGARAAYEVGVLRALSRRLPELEFSILTGVSAGAINTAILANHVGTLRDGVVDLAALWTELEVSNVFRTTPITLARRLLRTLSQLAGGVDAGEEIVRGVVDTSALREFLQRAMSADEGPLRGVAENLRTGRLKAVALTATCYATGEAVTFCAGRGIRAWRRPGRRSVATELTLDHVMASSALPLFYPAVAVDGAWYGDGEIGLIAPLAPAIHLGAGRILAISTWGGAESRTVESSVHPAPAEVLSVVYGAAFADRLDHDAADLERLNRLVRALPPESRLGHRDVKVLVVRPSADLGAVACEPGVEAPKTLRFLARRLDLRRARSRDLLSVLMLEHAYIRRLLAIGEEDGERRVDDVARFLAD